jgi:hypothetical protein
MEARRAGTRRRLSPPDRCVKLTFSAILSLPSIIVDEVLSPDKNQKVTPDSCRA